MKSVEKMMDNGLTIEAPSSFREPNGRTKKEDGSSSRRNSRNQANPRNQSERAEVSRRKNENRNNVILGKLEGNNPAGSVKDRPALSMISPGIRKWAPEYLLKSYQGDKVDLIEYVSQANTEEMARRLAVEEGISLLAVLLWRLCVSLVR